MTNDGMTPEQYRMLFGEDPTHEAVTAPSPPPPPPPPAAPLASQSPPPPPQTSAAALQAPIQPGTPPVAGPDDLEAERQRWLEFARSEFERIVAEIDTERHARYEEIRTLESQLEDLQATNDLQDIGMIFSGEHPLAASVEYKSVIDEARKRRKGLAKAKRAVTGNQSWAIGGDIAAGRKLVDEVSKLMLRAYNNELDAVVKATNATNAENKVDALGKKREQIRKLGLKMGLEITAMYHDLATYEIRQVGRLAVPLHPLRHVRITSRP